VGELSSNKGTALSGNHRKLAVELRQYLISTLDICDAFAPISKELFHKKLHGKKIKI